MSAADSGFRAPRTGPGGNWLTAAPLSDLGRWHVTEFVRRVAGELPPGTRILDAGAGTCAYRDWFGHCFYVAVDLAVGDPTWDYGRLDCLAALERLPFADAAFDAVLSTQTLEHVEWPRECVAEMARVLRPGGRLFLTVPMSQCEHQAPHDYFRYTSYGLRSILKHAGFDERDCQITALGGLGARLAYQLPAVQSLLPGAGCWASGFRARDLLAWPLHGPAWVAIRLMQHALLALDRRDRQRIDPWGWQVVAVKRDDADPILRRLQQASVDRF